MKRTLSQNKALHLFFEQLAEALDDGGYSVQQVLAEAVERPWTKESVKELIWRPIQEAMTGEHSTADLDKLDVDAVYEVLNRHLGQKFGIHVPFPSEESLSEEQRNLQ